MINLKTLSPEYRHTVIDAVSDLAEGQWAALAAGVSEARDYAEYFDLVHDKVVKNDDLDDSDLGVVIDALTAGEENCVDLGLDDAATEYADTRSIVESLS